jgi:hypothetical protein
MGADLGTFFENNNVDFFAAFLCQLTQPDCRCKPCGAAANDHDVEFHAFAFHTGPDPRFGL